jgi:hypothetical protein
VGAGVRRSQWLAVGLGAALEAMTADAQGEGAGVVQVD